MDDNIKNLFLECRYGTQQSLLDEPFFTFSALLCHANDTPKDYTLRDPASMCGNGFSNTITTSDTILMEEILPSEVYQHETRDWKNYNHSLNLSASASSYGMSDSEESYVTKFSSRT
jgi:hypothetical protein